MAFFFLLTLAAASAADAEIPAPPPVVRAVTDCQGVAADAERLRCFDAAASGLGAAVREGQITFVDKEVATAARKAAFGLSLPRLTLLDGAPGAPVDSIESKLVAARQDPVSRFWTFDLADGSQWRQISGEGDILAQPGDKAEVRRGAVGSFWIKIGGRPSVKVHRDR